MLAFLIFGRILALQIEFFGVKRSPGKLSASFCYTGLLYPGKPIDSECEFNVELMLTPSIVW